MASIRHQYEFETMMKKAHLLKTTPKVKIVTIANSSKVPPMSITKRELLLCSHVNGAELTVLPVGYHWKADEEDDAGKNPLPAALGRVQGGQIMCYKDKKVVTAHSFALAGGSKRERPYESVVLVKSKEYLKEHAEVGIL